ncbi:hypothetical protein F5I97DRAFT_1903389 [Phlebopus sp. FC_14]|nr:hypothetical protein F5I97DRAFT_1903389 [Phlebopus sp. FC_14]
MAAPRPEKNSLSIQLTEPVTFLRPQEHPRRYEDHTPPAVVRGLLSLKLAKPTKISSIEVELQGNAFTAWPEGAGPTRVEVSEQYKVHSASVVVFKAGPGSQGHRATSARPAVQSPIDQNEHQWQYMSPAHDRSVQGPTPTGCSRSASLDPSTLASTRVRRRRSSDELQFWPQSLTEPAPPYTPTTQPVHPDIHPTTSDFNGAGTSQSQPGSSRLNNSTELRQNSPARLPSQLGIDAVHGSPAFSMRSIRDLSLSRVSRSSMDGVPEDDQSVDMSASHSEDVGFYGLHRVTTGSSSRSTDQDHRGRSRSRFSFGKVTQVLDVMKERLRSQSPRGDSQCEPERGRTGNRRASAYGANESSAPHFGFNEVLGADVVNGKDGDRWTIFQEGIYTYPILFTIPNNAPPSMKDDHGSMSWKVRAEVKRPGAFKLRMTAQQDVVVVSAFAEDDIEEAGAIDVERQWENQLRYRIRIARRSFPIGGKVPIELIMMPLAKIKVHRILAHLDERTEYYTRAKTHARSQPIRRATLLSVQQHASDLRHNDSILPLVSDESRAFRQSPLYRFLGPGDDESELASSYMGPGPWRIRHQLMLPESCRILHPSNRAKGSNITIDHMLKVIIRVERENAAEQTLIKKKLHDIVVHIPIQILSCWCTPQWTSLPRYDESLDATVSQHSCPCSTRHRKQRTPSYSGEIPTININHVTSHQPTYSIPSGSPTGRVPDELPFVRRSNLYERLISGLESETGEAPPSYERFDVLCSP